MIEYRIDKELLVRLCKKTVINICEELQLESGTIDPNEVLYVSGLLCLNLPLMVEGTLKLLEVEK